MDEVNEEAALEAAHCALINFDNVTKMNPGLANHPIYVIARSQLVEAIGHLGRDVKEEN